MPSCKRIAHLITVETLAHAYSESSGLSGFTRLLIQPFSVWLTGMHTVLSVPHHQSHLPFYGVDKQHFARMQPLF